MSQLAKKTGVAKAKKSARVRAKKAASAEVKQEQDQSLEQATPAAEEGKRLSLLRLIKPKAQAKAEDKSAAEGAVVKKGAANKKKALEQKTKRALRTRESNKPKRRFFQGTVKFFQGVWGELKKVHWPGRRETAVYTMVVISSVVLVAAMIWIADTVLSTLVEILLSL